MNLRSTESLLEQGLQAKREHRLKYAQSLFKKALDESRSSSDQTLRARLFVELAYVERSLGELDHAITHYLRAADLCNELDQPLRWAHAARHAADILREQGKQDESSRLYAQVLKTYRGHQDSERLDLANAIRGYALLKTSTGPVVEAVALWEEARNLYQLEQIAAGIEESSCRIEALKAI